MDFRVFSYEIGGLAGCRGQRRRRLSSTALKGLESFWNDFNDEVYLPPQKD